LKVDSGRKLDLEPKRNNDKAATYEAHSGQQSFDSYVKERKAFIQKSFEQARDWQEFHKSLAEIGIEVRLRGNGCIIKDKHSKVAIKASRLDREFSKEKLVTKLGEYQKPALVVRAVKENERYVSRPLHKKRGELYAQYREAIDHRKKAYEDVKVEQDRKFRHVSAFWDGKIKEIRQDKKLSLKDRSRLLAVATGKKTIAVEAIKQDMAARRAELRKQSPFSRWNDFLKWKAESGDDVALQVLRSKKEPIVEQVQQNIPSSRSVSNWKLKQSQIRVDSNLAWRDKRRLLSLAKMLQLQAEEAKRTRDPDMRTLEKMAWRVDSSGNILYTLKNGGMVKDNGDKVFFSVSDPGARVVADNLAKRLFGPNLVRDGNVIGRKDICRSLR
jgi:hypothetical protein